MFLKWTEFDTEPVFVVVSNDKAVVVLDRELEEVFRNEEELGSTDLCFFTSVGIRRDCKGGVQGMVGVLGLCVLYWWIMGLWGYKFW